MSSPVWYKRRGIREYIVCYPQARREMALQLSRAHAMARGTDEALVAPSMYLNAIDVAAFPDGEPNILVPYLHHLTGLQVIYVADWSNGAARYNDMCALIPMAEMIGNGMLTIVVPFFGSATMERESVEGSIATANVDAKLLSMLPCKKRVVTVELHAQQEQFYYHDCVVSMKSCVPFALPVLRAAEGNFVAAFPDEGAKKRFASYFTDMDKAVCAKVRDGDERHVRLTDGNVAGRTVVIIDDLVRSGGTLVECAKALKAAGATKINIFVPHACFPKGEYERFHTGDGAALINMFYTTDSVAKSAEAIEKLNCSENDKKFYIFKMGEIIAGFFD
jgi:phosphoribosylpyrophosphate synthetase